MRRNWRRRIFRYLAIKTGKTITELKREFMESVIKAAKMYLGLKPGQKPGEEWFWALHEVLPVAYMILEKEKKIPTPKEILKAVKVKEEYEKIRA